MGIQSLEYEIFIVEDTYCIRYPAEYGYISGIQTTDGISELSVPGSFLMKIHNMNFSDIRDTTAFLKDTINDPETVDVDDAFGNFRDTIASWFMRTTDFDYCIASHDIELLADLISCQFYDAYESSGGTGSFTSTCNAIYGIQSMCFQLMEYREYTPEICSLIEGQRLSFSYCFVDGSPIKVYTIRTLLELFVMDTVRYMESREKLCRCKFCNKYFFKQEDGIKVYCPYPNPYKPYDGMSCKEYHAQHPKHKDRISELTKRAYRAQYKYISERERELLASNTFPSWNEELKKRERIARDKWSVSELEVFIENTRFSKIGFGVTDYSSY